MQAKVSDYSAYHKSEGFPSLKAVKRLPMEYTKLLLLRLEISKLQTETGLCYSLPKRSLAYTS